MSEAPLRPAPGPPRPYSFPAHTRTRLSNGLTVLTAPVRRLPICSLLVVVDAGAELDAQGEEGCALLTARAIGEGTAEFPGIAFTDRLERIGASLEAGADWDSAHFSLSLSAARLPDAFELLSAAIREPTFPAAELNRLREERLAEIVQLLSEPRGLANEAFSRVLYSPESRYSVQLGGTEQSVSRLDRDSLERFHRTMFTPARTTVIVAGDVSTEDVLALAERSFGGWRGAETGVSPRRGAEFAGRARVNVVHREGAPQSELRVGHAGVSRSHTDYFPLVLMNAVLGGLFSSRINLNLREEHGYTYGAHSGFDWRRGDGPFLIRTAVESGVTGAATTEILKEIAQIRSEDISDAELSLARDYLAGVFPVRFETSLAIAVALAQMVTYSLPGDFYDAYRENVTRVGIGDVRRVAQQYLDPERITVVVVGDASVVTGSLEALGLGEVASVPAEEAGQTEAISAAPTP